VDVSPATDSRGCEAGRLDRGCNALPIRGNSEDDDDDESSSIDM